MRRIARSLSYLTISLTGCLSWSSYAEAQGNLPPEDRAQASVESWAPYGTPGLVAVLAVDQKIIWSGTAGCRSLDPCEPSRVDDLYGAGSITKTFVSVLVHQLAGEGLIDLDQPVTEYIDPALVKGVSNVHAAPIRTLLNHTSGIPSWEEDPGWRRAGRGDEVLIGRIWQKAETLDWIRHQEALNAPGKAFRYSNTNYTLLGLVIEAVTGRDFASVLRDEISDPLQLGSIILEGFETVPSRRVPSRYHMLSRSFVEDVGVHDAFTDVSDGLIDVSLSNLSHEWAAGGLLVTASDLARFASALSAGALLSPDLQAKITTFEPIGELVSVGPGLFRMDAGKGVALIGHQGGALGFNAVMAWIEGTDAAIVILANLGTIHSGHGEEHHVSNLLSNEEFFGALMEIARSAKKQRRPEE
ncbi:MAG: serine hydrolase domain-containing protein [Pseudomonadota bacterium]